MAGHSWSGRLTWTAAQCRVRGHGRWQARAQRQRKDRPGDGDRLGPAARRRRVCGPAPSGWSSLPPSWQVVGSASGRTSHKVDPASSGTLKPRDKCASRRRGPLSRPAPANGTATAKRTAPIAFGSCTPCGRPTWLCVCGPGGRRCRRVSTAGTWRSHAGAAGSNTAARSAWPSPPMIRACSSRRAAFCARRSSKARRP